MFRVEVDRPATGAPGVRANTARSTPSVVTVDPAPLISAIEAYGTDRLDFAEAYLVACAESTGVGRVASFDSSIDRIDTVDRIEPYVGGGSLVL